MSEIKLNTPLSISDIDFRVQSINKGGYATILPYKDARVDMNRLDEAVGVYNWQKKYEVINGNLFCSIGIRDQSSGEWVWKQDVGVESYAEKEKGEASDAFKRAGFNLGIGRELYDYPLIQIKLFPDEFNESQGKVTATYLLNLKKWKWDSKFVDGKLMQLSCVDTKGRERYVYNSLVAQASPGEPKPMTEEQRTKLIFQSSSDCFTEEEKKNLVAWVAKNPSFEKANNMILRGEKKIAEHEANN